MLIEKHGNMKAFIYQVCRGFWDAWDIITSELADSVVCLQQFPPGRKRRGKKNVPRCSPSRSRLSGDGTTKKHPETTKYLLEQGHTRSAHLLPPFAQHSKWLVASSEGEEAWEKDLSLSHLRHVDVSATSRFSLSPQRRSAPALRLSNSSPMAASASARNRWKRPLTTLASSIRSSLNVTLWDDRTQNSAGGVLILMVDRSRKTIGHRISTMSGARQFSPTRQTTLAPRGGGGGVIISCTVVYSSHA